MTKIRKVEIYRQGDSQMFTVIADGFRVSSLAWDEMLGHVAKLTVGLRAIYSDPISASWWEQSKPKLLLENNPVHGVTGDFNLL